MRKVLAIYGTRPEAIKMAPIVREIERSPHLDMRVAVTGQHRELLDQVNSLFGITPAHDLDIIRPRQSLEEITVNALAGLGEVIRAEAPDMVATQGDTTTSMVAALAAFYQRVPVVHVEAGLRTSNSYSPYPEEINRRLTAQLASLHLAPTPGARANLIAENIAPETIVTTGNTVIDALIDVAERDLPFTDPLLRRLHKRRIVLVTAHRRESWGRPMERSARALARLATMFPDVYFVLPTHPNPVVREALLPALAPLPNVVIVDPLPYDQFARIMGLSTLVLTDSGGVQEEAPSLGKPVLVLRDTTERPEGIEAGTVRLVGTDEDRIVKEVGLLLTDKDEYQAMATAVNPYGDGQAARRSVGAIEHFFGIGERPDEFQPYLRGPATKATSATRFRSHGTHDLTCVRCAELAEVDQTSA
jgi:UDP-N-acetylglucosamine 2-epimerase (non-hydrolysing)